MDLIDKYNIAAPRYTSYPTVPYWDPTSFSVDGWKASVKQTFDLVNAQDGVSLYIHLPYCESLCTFCACHKRITKNHSVEESYIYAVLQEWRLYVALFGSKPKLAEIHLGGGTPSFFSAANLSILINGILEQSELAENYEFGFEGHPSNTSYAHLLALYELGFRRVSFGVQDHDERVQKAIHRFQPLEQVIEVTQWARQIGYTSISYDLVYGLPFQTIDTIRNTIDKTIALKPDRIAFYSYAHVPWLKGNGQRGFNDADLPSGEEKRALYELGLSLFSQHGYEDIGMDHFALPDDALFKAMERGELHRNFMGYTTTRSRLLIGLGASAIGDSWTGFAQNEKDIDQYKAAIERAELPVTRGHLLNNEDIILRRHILNLMCRFETSWQDLAMQCTVLNDVIDRLAEPIKDGLVEFGVYDLKVTDKGKAFLRNICMAFDVRLWRELPTTAIFSKSV